MKMVRLAVAMVLIAMVPVLFIFARDVILVSGSRDGADDQVRRQIVVQDLAHALERSLTVAELGARDAVVISPDRPIVLPTAPRVDPAASPTCSERAAHPQPAAARRYLVEQASLEVVASNHSVFRLAGMHACLVATPFGQWCRPSTQQLMSPPERDVIERLAKRGFLRISGEKTCWAR